MAGVHTIPKPGQEIPKTVKLVLRGTGLAFSNPFVICRLRGCERRGMTCARERAFSPERHS